MNVSLSVGDSSVGWFLPSSLPSFLPSVAVAVIEDMRPESVLVETELFPRGALEYYTAKNMGWDISEEDTKKWWLQERGGDQVSPSGSQAVSIAGSLYCRQSGSSSSCIAVLCLLQVATLGSCSYTRSHSLTHLPHPLSFPAHLLQPPDGHRRGTTGQGCRRRSPTPSIAWPRTRTRSGR